MKKYKLVYLNKSVQCSRDKDLIIAETALNQYIANGWALQQIVSLANGAGALVAVLYSES